jgi:hypothetical protein
MRRFILALIVLALAATIYVGFREGPFAIRSAENGKQLVVHIAQIVYASSALAALIGLARRRVWAVGAAAVWSASAVTAGAFATVAWDDAGFGAAISAAAFTAVITGGVVWYLHYLSRSWTA